MVRHKVRPGITGWAQVDGLRRETSTIDKMQQRVQYDLDYLKNRSLWLDLKILARTALIVDRGVRPQRLLADERGDKPRSWHLLFVFYEA